MLPQRLRQARAPAVWGMALPPVAPGPPGCA